MKLRVLLFLIGASIFMSLVTFSVTGVILNVMLFAGVLKGSDAIMTLVMILAGLSLIVGVGVMFIGFALVRADGLAGILTMAVGALSTFSSAFTLWCVRQPDVKRWMMRKALGVM